MKRRLSTLLWIALALVLFGSLLAWAVQTGGGQIKILDVRFVGSNGTPMSALLYIPPNATAETPAPGIVAIHGYINSRETQSGYAIEFARRGYVVLAADQTGHGFSGGAAFANGFGGPDALAYLRTLDIVDPDNIGLEGHSMGGWASLIAAGVMPDSYKAIVLQGSSTGTFGAGEGTPDWPRNLGLVYSKYDEFSELMWLSPTAQGIVETDKLQALFGTDEAVEVGQLYGSIEAGTARQLYQPNTTHPGDHLSQVAIGNAIDWFQQTLEGGNGLPASNQIWYWKEFGTLLAFIGLVLSFFPLGGLLLRTSYFRQLDDALPTARPATGWGWWLGALLLAAISALTFFPLNHLSDAGGILNWQASATFPQNITSGIMLWAVGNAVIALVLFLLWHFLVNKKAGATLENYGVTWRRGLLLEEIGKSFLLAALIAAIAYMILSLMHGLFQVDFRYWIVALKPMNASHFRAFLGYLIPFTFYFLVIGMVLHGQMRRLGSRRAAVYNTAGSRKGGKSAKRRSDREYAAEIEEDRVPLWQAILTNIGLLISGIVILLLIQYIGLFTRGQLTYSAEPLLSIVGIQFVPILAIVAAISTYFFRKTGRIYVGAFLNAIFVTWYIVAGQAFHFPL